MTTQQVASSIRPPRERHSARSAATDPPSKEFGGAPGAVAIIVLSHVLLYYLWGALTFHRGALYDPRFLPEHVLEAALPTLSAAAIYFGFLSLQFAFAWFMPGVWVKGLPVPSEGHVQHRYLCNGAASWYATLVLGVALQVTGLFRLSRVVDQLGSLITVAVLFADLVSVLAHVISVRRGRATRMTGDVLYDFFAGAVLNPRVGRVDLKFFGEIRVSWLLLFLLTASAAVAQYEATGALSWPMIFMLCAHGLYTNAAMKGEECIPTTWDVFHEKWGWMLIFWNLVGVPFVYCFNSFYVLVAAPVAPSSFTMALLFLALLLAYYVWDSSQSQKNRFRMQLRGTYVARRTFPQLPWATLENPRYLRTENGGTLLVDGWWRYARKIHYAADIVMAFSWALACGFGGALPWLYPTFFLGMIMHRALRDERRCREKYGADWDRYLAEVPNRFLPDLRRLWSDLVGERARDTSPDMLSRE